MATATAHPKSTSTEYGRKDALDIFETPNENKISDGWPGGAPLQVEGGISWKVTNRDCQPLAAAASLD